MALTTTSGKTPAEKALELALAAEAAVADLLVNKGLYHSLETTSQLGASIETRIRHANLAPFDCYCTKCKQITSFLIAPIPIAHSGGGLREGNALANPPAVFALRAVCQRDLTTYLFVFHKFDKKIVKIGQHPSTADIALGELKDIGKSLDPLDRKELGKAIGLFAHDAASGAFVYLRRVFERMIVRAHERHTQSHGPIEGFDRLQMDRRIAALSAELPEKLVQHKEVFGVLSAGIHELSDDRCAELFPVLKAVIFQILEQEEHKRRKANNDRITDAAFAALLTSGFRKGGDTA